MGDVAMTVPVVALKVAAASRPSYHPDFQSPLRGDVWQSERFNFVGTIPRKYHGLVGIFRLFRDLRKTNRFDAVADLQ